jgi:hypothetical protein
MGYIGPFNNLMLQNCLQRSVAILTNPTVTQFIPIYKNYEISMESGANSDTSSGEDDETLEVIYSIIAVFFRTIDFFNSKLQRQISYFWSFT